MEILKKIAELKKSVLETSQLVDELIVSLEKQTLMTKNKEQKILVLKDEVRTNVEKIDEIIENYNANN